MSFSLIYICCSFRGGILSVVFRTVAICFWPARNLECPYFFSDLILFPFILLFFYIVPYPSFSSISMSFSLIYICCSFWGRHSICCFPHCSHMFLTRMDLECPCLFSDLILFPFLLLFFYIVPYPSFSMSFSLIYHRRKGRVRNNIEEKEEKREEDKVGKETRALQVPCGSETYGYSGENSR